MCLLVLAWKAHLRYELVVAANRDEFHARETAPLGLWSDPPGVLAGRDLRAGGTWLGAAEEPSGSEVPRLVFGAITNHREASPQNHAGPSRGALIPDFYSSALKPGDFLQAIEKSAAGYAGFNLLLVRGDELWYASNRVQRFARALEPGIYGLSNHTLDTPWPKLERIREGFGELLSAHPGGLDPGELLLLLDQRQSSPPGASWEEVLEAPFVVNPIYGTRSSTVVLAGKSGQLSITERRFDPQGRRIGETSLGTGPA